MITVPYAPTVETPWPALGPEWAPVLEPSDVDDELAATARGIMGELPEGHYADVATPSGRLVRLFSFPSVSGVALGAARLVEPSTPAAGDGSMGDATACACRACALREQLGVAAGAMGQCPGCGKRAADMGAVPASASYTPPGIALLAPRYQPPYVDSISDTLQARVMRAEMEARGGAWRGFMGYSSDDPVNELNIVEGTDEAGTKYQKGGRGEPVPLDDAKCHWAPTIHSRATDLANAISFNATPQGGWPGGKALKFADQRVYDVSLPTGPGDSWERWKMVCWIGDCRGDGGSYHCVSTFRCEPVAGPPGPPGPSPGPSKGGLIAGIVGGVAVVGLLIAAAATGGFGIGGGGAPG